MVYRQNDECCVFDFENQVILYVEETQEFARNNKSRVSRSDPYSYANQLSEIFKKKLKDLLRKEALIFFGSHSPKWYKKSTTLQLLKKITLYDFK